MFTIYDKGYSNIYIKVQCFITSIELLIDNNIVVNINNNINHSLKQHGLQLNLYTQETETRNYTEYNYNITIS